MTQIKNNSNSWFYIQRWAAAREERWAVIDSNMNIHYLPIDKFGTRSASLIGHLTLLVGLIVLTQLRSDAPIWLYIVIITIGGSGLSIFLPANNSAIMGFVPRDSLSIASGFLATSRSMGSSIGMALAAAIYASTLGSGKVSEAINTPIEAVYAVNQGITVVAIVSAIGLVAIILRGRG